MPLGQPVAKKHKTHPSINASGTTWNIDQLNDNVPASTPVSEKWPRTSTSTTGNVRFEGVVIQKATRWSPRVAQTSTKKDVKDLFRYLEEAHTAARQACGELAEAMDWI